MFSPEHEDQIKSALLAGEYNLLIGAGVSLDSKDRNGDDLPSGRAFNKELCLLKGVNEGASLQRVFSTLTPEEIKRHVTDRFSECQPGPSVQKLKAYLWRRVFTLNVDDALEAAYASDDALQQLSPINFTDDFVERDNLGGLQVIHLHGWVSRPLDSYVFATSEYVRLLKSMNPWMVNLSQFIPNEPFIIVGTQLDEVDIEYYLSFRSLENSRKDRPPSILISPNPDNLTKSDCRKYDLALFEGTLIDFIEFFLPKTGRAKGPHELLEANTAEIFPEAMSNKERLAFFSDFEVIPSDVEGGAGLPQFLYGAEPSWVDICRGIDIGRGITRKLLVDIDQILGRDTPEKSFILFVDETGAGKTTIMKRLGVEAAQKNAHALWCYTSARLEVGRIADAIDLVDDNLFIFFDNIADNIGQVCDIFDTCEKPNLTFVACERSYRIPYLTEALRGTDYSITHGRDFDRNEAVSLIDLYGRHGLIGTQAAVNRRTVFAGQISRDPISVACCRILNDFRPLKDIIRSVWEDAGADERFRYLVSALATRCFRGGIRSELLRKVSGVSGWEKQLDPIEPLPISYSVEFGREFVKPLNESIAEQMLLFCAQNDLQLLLKAFVELGAVIASRVNRLAIRRRAPEARIAGSLFDYDRTVKPFLGDLSDEFYTEVSKSWLWNSRFWEQVALMHLDRFYTDPNSTAGVEAYRLALQHARHSTSIEWHPHPLTTLGKVLFSFSDATDVLDEEKFDEGQKCLYDAIMMEQKWARINVQPFKVYLTGTRRHLERGGRLSSLQFQGTRRILDISEKYFKDDPVVQDELVKLRDEMFDL